MIILDTNVVSETMKPRPNLKVVNWLDEQAASHLYLTAVVEAELLYGAMLLEGSRRRDLITRIETLMGFYVDRVLSFDRQAAPHYAEILTARRSRGLVGATAGLQIAAIARAHGAALAARNIRDFEESGIELINPWEA